MTTPVAKLALEDGTVYTGRAFGAPGETPGEVVFNTSMTGYQEILTDPSYNGQIVAMTYPQIGNYGVNADDVESGKLAIKGFIVRELCHEPSNYRSTESLSDYLGNHEREYIRQMLQANQAPRFEFLQAHADVGTGKIERRGDLVRVERPVGKIKQGVDLAYRAVDAPAAAHFAEVQDKVLYQRRQVLH